MKRIILLAAFLLLAGCSSAELSLSDLKENYPESVAEPLKPLSQKKQSQIGLPDDLPFTVASVTAKREENKVEILYRSESTVELMVRTIYQPANILKDRELEIPLNSGAVAGVQSQKETVYVEWYNSEDDVIYQIEYHSTNEEKRTEQAVNIANAI